MLTPRTVLYLHGLHFPLPKPSLLSPGWLQWPLYPVFLSHSYPLLPILQLQPENSIKNSNWRRQLPPLLLALGASSSLRGSPNTLVSLELFPGPPQALWLPPLAHMENSLCSHHSTHSGPPLGSLPRWPCSRSAPLQTLPILAYRAPDNSPKKHEGHNTAAVGIWAAKLPESPRVP